MRFFYYISIAVILLCSLSVVEAHVQTLPFTFSWSMQNHATISRINANTYQFPVPVFVLNAWPVYCCKFGGINLTFEGGVVNEQSRFLHWCNHCSNDIEEVHWNFPSETRADKVTLFGVTPYTIGSIEFVDYRGTHGETITQKEGAKPIGRIKELIKTKHLSKVQVSSDNPQVVVWVSDSTDYDKQETDDFDDVLYACLDMNKNDNYPCDFLAAKDCEEAKDGSYYLGVCCGTDVKCGEQREFSGKKAFCGKTLEGIHQWVTPEEVGEIHTFVCPQQDVVHIGTELKDCGSDQSFTIGKKIIDPQERTITNEYLCRGGKMQVCGGSTSAKFVSSINILGTGQKGNSGEYCASDGDFTYDLDGKDGQTCTSAGQTDGKTYVFTGSRCCQDDSGEYYNDQNYQNTNTPGGCFNSVYVPAGNYGKKFSDQKQEDKRTMNYQGNFIFCDPIQTFAPVPVQTSMDQELQALNLFTPVASCGSGFPDARSKGLERHARCQLNGLFTFHESKALTAPKQSPTPPYSSMLLNPLFDEGLTHWTTVIGQGHVLFGPGDVRIESFAFAKEKVVRMMSTGTHAVGIQSAQVPVSQQQVYTASADVLCTEGTGQVTLAFKTQAGNVLTQTASSAALNTWSRVNVTAASLAATQATVLVHTPQQKTSTCYFDNVILDKGAPKQFGKDTAHLGCCTGTECWNGATCAINNTYFDAGEDGFHCFEGLWKPARKKSSPDRIMSGFCPEQDQCLVHALGNDLFNNQPEKYYLGNPLVPTTIPRCINHSQYIFDFFCNKGEWTSRTKLLAVQLLSLAQQSQQQNYTLSCDSSEHTLNTLVYDPGRGVVEQFIRKPCVVENKLAPCVNNFCVLKFPDGTAAIATSSNIPIDGTQSILRAFNTSETSCSTAQLAAAGTHSFAPCNPLPPIAGSLWYNPDINSVVYLPPTLQTALQDTFTSKQLQSVIQYVFTKHDPEDPRLNLSFFNRTTVFNTLFYGQRTSQNMFAFLEQNQTPNRYNYLGIRFANISLGEDPCFTYFKRADPFAICENQTSTQEFVLISKTNKLATLFADLSAKLRIT